MSAHHYSVGSVADKWRPGCCARATTDDKENRSRLSLQNFFMADQAIKRLGYKLCWVSPEDFLDCCICIVTPNGLIQRRGFGEFGGVPRLWLSRGRGLVAVWLDCPSGQRNRSGRYTAAAKLENRPYRGRGAWGSDPRPLRLTMDGLLDRTCGERPRASRIGIVPRSDLPED